jgi:UDP-N-acetylmuramate dehydrogenase
MTSSEAPAVLEELKAIVPGVKAGEPMSRHTTFAIGGPADFYAEVKTSDQLQAVSRFCAKRGLPLFPVGQGSNLLVGDKGIRGVVVHLAGDFETLEFRDEEVEAGAGVALPYLAKQCAERGLAGAEPFVGVPGTVGGGLMTNAGTREGDIGSLVERVEVLEAGERRILEKKDLHFSYRHSNPPVRFVLRVWLKLRRGDKNVIIRNIQHQLTRRAQTQPLGTFNVGSIFKNPPGDFAARLVEAAGLKGHRVGGAEVSTRHANFIINVGRAKAEDVNRLIAHIQETVFSKFGVRLELEMWRAGE